MKLKEGKDRRTSPRRGGALRGRNPRADGDGVAGQVRCLHCHPRASCSFWDRRPRSNTSLTTAAGRRDLWRSPLSDQCPLEVHPQVAQGSFLSPPPRRGLAAGASRPPRQRASSEKKKRELAPPGKGRRPKDKAKPLRLCSTKPLWGRRGHAARPATRGCPPRCRSPSPCHRRWRASAARTPTGAALRLSPRVRGCP